MTRSGHQQPALGLPGESGAPGALGSLCGRQGLIDPLRGSQAGQRAQDESGQGIALREAPAAGQGLDVGDEGGIGQAHGLLRVRRDVPRRPRGLAVLVGRDVGIQAHGLAALVGDGDGHALRLGFLEARRELVAVLIVDGVGRHGLAPSLGRCPSATVNGVSMTARCALVNTKISPS